MSPPQGDYDDVIKKMTPPSTLLLYHPCFILLCNLFLPCLLVRVVIAATVCMYIHICFVSHSSKNGTWWHLINVYQNE